MGFITNVNDIARKNKLIENLLFHNGSIVTIIASGVNGDLKPLQEIYEDRDNLERSIYAKDFDIKEKYIDNDNNTYSAVMSIVRI